jgi:hypothetical protein
MASWSVTLLGIDRHLAKGCRASRIGLVGHRDPRSGAGFLDRNGDGAEGGGVERGAVADDLVEHPLGHDQRDHSGRVCESLFEGGCVQ